MRDGISKCENKNFSSRSKKKAPHLSIFLRIYLLIIEIHEAINYAFRYMLILLQLFTKWKIWNACDVKQTA